MSRPAGQGREGRGVAWVVASFAACPCHLPLTLAALTAVLGGTAAGALLRDHLLLAGGVVTLAWGLGTLRGVWLLRRPKACPTPNTETGGLAGRPRARILQDTLRS